MKWFVKCIRNYVNFEGRARRSEYWYFCLFSILFLLVALLLDYLLFGTGRRVLYSLLVLFLFLPQTAVMIRRLHDIGRSGKIVLWYYLLFFLWIVALLVTGTSSFFGMMSGASTDAAPVGFLAVMSLGGLAYFVWGIFFLVWFCTAGTPGDNKYGPDPKAE